MSIVESNLVLKIERYYTQILEQFLRKKCDKNENLALLAKAMKNFHICLAVGFFGIYFYLQNNPNPHLLFAFINNSWGKFFHTIFGISTLPKILVSFLQIFFYEMARTQGINKRNNLFDTLIVLSSRELSTWQRYHHNVRVIPNFILEIPSKSTNHAQRFILSVGRMDKGDQKGFLRLPDIWKIVQECLACHTEGIARSISNGENKDISHSLNMTNDSKEIFRYAQNDKVEVAQNDKNQDCHSERSAKHEAKNPKEIHKDNENSLDSSATLSPQNDKSLDSHNDDNLTQWKLIIVGDGVLKKEIESKIKELNLQDSIILKPFTKQIEKEYLNASIYAMSSHWEGFGMVLAEASSYGLPCVAFDVKTGPSDIITHNQSGKETCGREIQQRNDYGEVERGLHKHTNKHYRRNFIFAIWVSFFGWRCKSLKNSRHTRLLLKFIFRKSSFMPIVSGVKGLLKIFIYARAVFSKKSLNSC